MFGVFFSFIFITCTLTNKLTKCPSDFLISCADLVAPTPTKGKFKLYSKDTKKTLDTPPPPATPPINQISSPHPLSPWKIFLDQCLCMNIDSFEIKIKR